MAQLDSLGGKAFDMITPRRDPVASVAISAFCGWCALLGAFACWSFFSPHGAPEIGRLAAFVLFGAILTGFYLCNVLLILLPSCFFIRANVSSVLPWQCSLTGAALFAVSAAMWSLIFGHRELYDIVFCSVLAAVSGSVSFYVLRRTSPPTDAT